VDYSEHQTYWRSAANGLGLLALGMTSAAVALSASKGHMNWSGPFMIVAYLAYAAAITCFGLGVAQARFPLARSGRPPERKRRSQLVRGDCMFAGKPMYSADGRTRFELTPGANMIVYRQGLDDLCDTGRLGPGKASYLRLEHDGRLVVYDVNDKPIWASPPGGDQLDVQKNSHVVLRTAEDECIWATEIFVKAGFLAQHRMPVRA
jgi:hypothetical protein